MLVFIKPELHTHVFPVCVEFVGQALQTGAAAVPVFMLPEAQDAGTSVFLTHQFVGNVPVVGENVYPSEHIYEPSNPSIKNVVTIK